MDDTNTDAMNVLQRLGQGRALQEFAAAYATVAAEVVETGKPGEVSLTLKMTVREQGDAAVLVVEQIKRKVPVRAARGTFVYSVEGWLYAVDPRQQHLPFREVDRPAAEQRRLDDTAPEVREA